MENYINYKILRKWFENHISQGGEVLFFDYYEYFKNTWKDTVKIEVNNQQVPNGYAFPQCLYTVKKQTIEFVNNYVNLSVNNEKEEFWKEIDGKLRKKLDTFNHSIHFLYFLYKKYNIFIPPVVMYNADYILPVHGAGRIYNLAYFQKKINVFYVKYKNDIYPNYNYRTINLSSELWNLITANLPKEYQLNTSIRHLESAMSHWYKQQNGNHSFFWILIEKYHTNFTKTYQQKALEMWKACQENPIRLGETTIILDKE